MYPGSNKISSEIKNKGKFILRLCLLTIVSCLLSGAVSAQVQDAHLETLIQTYRYNEAIEYIDVNISRNQIQDSTQRLYFLTRLSSLQSRKGEVQAAYKTSMQGRFLYPFVTDSFLITEARLADAIANINKGSFAYALEELEMGKASILRLQKPCKLERTLSHAYSLIFIQTGKTDAALTEIQRALHLDTTCQLRMYLANDMINLSLLYVMKGDIRNSDITIKNAAEIASSQKDSIVWGGCLLLQAHLHYIKGETENWRKTIRKTIELGKRINHPTLIIGGFSQMMEKALQQKHYTEAISLGKELEGIMVDHPLPTFKFHLDSSLYEAYKGIHDNEKALQYFEAFYRNKRQIFNESYKDKLQELQTSYALKEKNLQLDASRNDLKNARKRQVFLSVIIILLILLVIGMFIVRSLKRKHAKRLYQKEKLMEVILEEEKQMFGMNRTALKYSESKRSDDLLLEDQEVFNDQNQQSQEDRRELYEEILRLMEEEKMYLNPDLTQKHLITQLATNKKYLYQAISRNADDNFKNLLNRYRVREAKKLIEKSVKGGNVEPIDQIFRSAGFNSETSYYRAFKHFTGLTPKEYAREYERDIRS